MRAMCFETRACMHIQISQHIFVHICVFWLELQFTLMTTMLSKLWKILNLLIYYKLAKWVSNFALTL